MKRTHFGLLAVALIATACSESGEVTGPAAVSPDASKGLEHARIDGGAAGTVYTATNATAGNEILVYGRSGDGVLELVDRVATGGLGTGSGLGNQGGLVATGGGRWLLAVNAGDNTISVLRRGPRGDLSLSDVVGSGGEMPISVARHGTLVYVLNAGGDGAISGFRLVRGKLRPIDDSARPLSQPAPGPAQISFTNDGSRLVVTEKGTNRIVTYLIHRRTGLASEPIVNASAGATPFGFAFDSRGRLIVSNAAGGAPGAGSLTSYLVRRDGSLDPIDIEVPNFQAAPCWVVVTNDGRFAYTTNTGSNTTSGYRIDSRGRLELLEASGASGTNTGAPIDAAVSQRGGRFLYVLNGSGNAIDAFRIGSRGELTSIAGGITGLPPGTNGLVAF